MNSELRKDIVSGDWILMVPGRGKRPEEFTKKELREITPVDKCPFEKKFDSEIAIASYPNNSDWKVRIVPNKYPAVYSSHNIDPKELNRLKKVVENGPYITKAGFGHHDLVITRDHDKDFPDLSKENSDLVFQSFRDHYINLSRHTNIAYAGIFHNFGRKAGASIYHPHYQMLGISVLPPDVSHSLMGSARYFKKHKKCVHCVILDWEIKEKKRIIYENESAIAFAPYVSRTAFEVRIFPKMHFPYFEDTPLSVLHDVSDALKHVLNIFKSKFDPDYNFFIHTAPIFEKEKYAHYHWHIEILPKIGTYAGFELETGIEINTTDPDEVARLIR